MPQQLDSKSLDFLLSNVNAFIFDADGVLWLGDTVIPGSPQFIEHLLSKGKTVIVLTNNSSRSRNYIVEKLHCLGYTGLAKENVVTPGVILVDLLKTKFCCDKNVYLIGSDGLNEEFEAGGIKCFGHGPSLIPENEIDDDVFLNEDSILYRNHLRTDVGAVIVGFDKYFNYVKLLLATNYLQNSKCLFFGTNEDETSPGPCRNTVIPDTGPILAAVKLASGRTPLIVGKPSTFAFEYIAKHWNLRPENALMIGDRLNTDICFGKENNLKTLLVLSGSHTLADLQSYHNNPKMVPDYISPCLGSLIN
uniref:Phosphoglycolate phosphatase n=1 Tax=Syphacia muris TaxID=451379 RepID=A0A0N5AQ46_9BILA